MKNEPKNKLAEAIAGISITAVIIFIVYAVFFRENEVKTRKQTIEQQFSAWDGSCLALTDSIKKTLYLPSSFEHLQTIYSDQTTHLLVEEQFVASDKYNNRIIYAASCRLDGDDKISNLRIVEIRWE